MIRRDVGFLIGLNLLVFSSLTFGKETNVIEERQNRFKQTSILIKAAKTSISKNNYSQAIVHIENIDAWLYEMSDYFTDGTQASVSNKSSASLEIWKNFQEFRTLTELSRSSARQLIHALGENENDNLKIKRAFKNFAKTCSECHRRFRN